MTLPFVSRTSFEALERHCERLATENHQLRSDHLAKENAWLREQVEELQDHVTRLVRRRNGMTETKTPQRRAPVQIERSAQLQAFIADFDPTMREDLDRRSEALLRDGHGPQAVISTLKSEYGIE